MTPNSEIEQSVIDEHGHSFEDTFLDAVDAWFSSDIACCDECYDQFIERWPLAYTANNEEFQRRGISLDLIYSGTVLQEIYSKQEYDILVRTLHCQNCGAQLTANIWPYNHPFNVDPGFEGYVEEIAAIARTTPFLLLNHPFAKKISECISDLEKSTTPTIVDHPLYRARLLSSLSALSPQEFDLPPKYVVSEGRYNHAGNPVLYLASDIRTCHIEMREQPCAIAKIKIDIPLRILDLIDPYDHHRKHSDMLDMLTYSALISAKQDNNGWHKPSYVFSRFLTDCARAANFDAIKYPSTRMNRGNYNIAIIRPTFSLISQAAIQAYFIKFPCQVEQEITN